ncbi:MAG: hypothetical protein J1F10_03555 [Muribaculaceae bacterium]|nr:hypothetical protein [Muribaculaceae bacterium]
MTELEAILQRLKAKSEVLAEKYQALKAAKLKVDNENESLKQQMIKLQQLIEQQHSEINYLKLAHAIAHTPEEIANSKAILTKLVRDVDKCISQLTD